MAWLQPIAEQLNAWRREGVDVFCFFLNDDSNAAMPHNAKMAKERACVAVYRRACRHVHGRASVWLGVADVELIYSGTRSTTFHDPSPQW